MCKFTVCRFLLRLGMLLYVFAFTHLSYSAGPGRQNDPNIGGQSDAQNAITQSNALKAASNDSLWDALTLPDTNPEKPRKIWEALTESGGADEITPKNTNTRNQLRDRPPGGAPTDNGPPGNPDTTITNICLNSGAGCTCNGTDCSNPQLNLPDANDIRESIRNSFANNPDVLNGKTLDEALSEFDTKYDKAKASVDNFNAASNNGTLNGESPYASDDGSLQNDGAADGAKKLASAENMGSAYGAGSAHDDKASSIPGVSGDFFGKRKPLVPVQRPNELTLVDSRTGKLLTIFERTTRALRGERDRALVLAKVEWARKEIAKKKKATNKNSLAKSQSDIPK